MTRIDDDCNTKHAFLLRFVFSAFWIYVFQRFDTNHSFSALIGIPKLVISIS